MEMETNSKTILITPLNWGLGHATRCIPIVKILQNHNYIPIIASDGEALCLLKKEFPYIKILELPSYKIEYPKKGKNFQWKLLFSIPKIAKAILKEHKVIAKWIHQYDIEGIISDNRLGCYSTKVPSVYLTHQVTVLSGKTTWLASFVHQLFIKKFKECWVPDHFNEINIAGKLSHSQNKKLNLKYIGPISRFHKKEIPKQYDLMIILSGPEPQRGILDTLLQKEIKRYDGKVLYIHGIIEKEQKTEQNGTVTFYNFMNTKQLEKAINESETILCRSGYTSIMDVEKLEKKAFFIPTPGQYEQEYLASKLNEENIAPFENQEDFKIENLEKLSSYKGFKNSEKTTNWEQLLRIFE
ncbi:glycosyltransferase [Flavobacterium sp.]|uniref:glycosyltransferase n=1 Tax=Flavobacterium sp. TaxID=239 RepID=UPI003C5A81E3